MLHWNTWWLPPSGPPGTNGHVPPAATSDVTTGEAPDLPTDWPTDWLGWQTRCWQEWFAYQQSWWRVWTLLTPPEDTDRPTTRH